MTWLTLFLLLATSPGENRTSNVEVVLTCVDHSVDVSIVLGKTDIAYSLHQVEKDTFARKLPVGVLIYDGTPASLRLRGHRTDCGKPRFSSDGSVAHYTFDCAEKEAADVAITFEPQTAAVPLAVPYERHLKGDESPDRDCFEEETIHQKKTIRDVGVDEEVILKFRSKAGASGKLRTRKLIQALRGGPLPLAPRDLTGREVVRKGSAQQAEDTGYLASIAIDIYGEALAELKILTIQVMDHK